MLQALDGDGPEMPSGIEDRTADCWEPLLPIADVAGGAWPDRARKAAKHLTKAAKDDIVTTGIELLAHIHDAFLNADQIWTSTLLDRLHNREESPWLNMGKGRKLNDRILADMLGEYGIKSSKQIKISGTNRRGYARATFIDAWKRYLPVDSNDAPNSAASSPILMLI